MEGVAYLVRGGRESLPALLSHIHASGAAEAGSPDLYVREYDQFGIGEAVEICSRAALRGVSRARVFVIVAPLMTQEAQNALLKTLEEPRGGASFFFLTPSPDTLLPTLRSRAQTFALSDAPPRSDAGLDPCAFLAAAIPERLDMLKGFLPSKKGEAEGSEAPEGGVRNIGGALSFLEALERVFAAKRAAETAEGRRGIAAVLRARKYLADKGALLKTLLEQVALFAPRM